MPGYYDKDKLKNELDIANIYDLITEFGGEPEYISENVIVAQTICHNAPGDGSRKLYYYDNTKLFKCYTECDDSFDLFQLVIKVFGIQKHKKLELYDAMSFVAGYFGLSGIEFKTQDDQLKDWDILKEYTDLSLRPNLQLRERPRLQEYDPLILTKFSYPSIATWEREGISREMCRRNLIGYYPRKEQITIPHFDIDGRLIGIRGRFLSDEDAKQYGKYKPLTVNHITYNHPLSANLYNLNNSKSNISKVSAAIIFEGEKSTLLYQSYYGKENDISVACCGSNISSFQVKLLLDLGVKEIIVAFDKDFKELGDEIFLRITNKLMYIYNKYKNIVRVSFIFDKENILPEKSSPIDQGPKIFEQLLKNRIVL